MKWLVKRKVIKDDFKCKTLTISYCIIAFYSISGPNNTNAFRIAHLSQWHHQLFNATTSYLVLSGAAEHIPI